MLWLILTLLGVANGGPRNDAMPVIALDAGHGGEHEGALGRCGLREKELTLALTQQIAAILQASGRVQVLQTRPSDHTVSLEARAERARSAGASLLLSVHANASTHPGSHGVETFFLSRAAADQRLAHLAQVENDGHRVPELSTPADPLAAVLAGLSLDSAHRESQALALRVQAILQARLHSRGRGVLQAPFWLLYRAEMPAVLVEVGFLSHPEECARLATAGHQALIAGALSTAVLAHLSTYALLAAEP